MNSKTDIILRFDHFLDCVIHVSKEFNLSRKESGAFFASIPLLETQSVDTVFSNSVLQHSLERKKEIIARAQKEFPEFKKKWEKEIKPIEEEYKKKYEKQIAQFNWIKILEEITGFSFPFETLKIYISPLMGGGDSRPDKGIVVESTRFDMTSVMHEAAHIILRQGNLKRASLHEETICLFIEAKFRELYHGTFITSTKGKELQEVQQLQKNWQCRNKYPTIIEFATFVFDSQK